MLMRTEPNPESRPRLILGAAMIALPALGLWHLWSGSPEDPGRAASTPPGSSASPSAVRCRTV